jgi:uncharacterized protein
MFIKAMVTGEAVEFVYVGDSEPSRTRSIKVSLVSWHHSWSAVIMAHGIGGIKAGGLAPFAERFREEGFAAIAFDYRNFGGSGGQPREVLAVPRQRADYSTVIGWAVEQPDIDRRQIIVWGTSFAGMHVVELAISDTRLAAAVAQAPLTDGLAAAMMSPLKNGIRLFGLALLVHRHAKTAVQR